MRKLILLAGLALPLLANAQLLEHLYGNNADASISDQAVFFNNPFIFTPGYEIPKGSGSHTVYAMAPWISGIDMGGQLHGAFNTYGGSTDYFMGPVADDYASAYYTSVFGTSIWSVTQAEIDYHTANYMTSGYVPAAAIADWPGNGDANEGVAEQLAPYVDVNGDMIYNPLDGDYPDIYGDYATFVIMNDMAGTHATGTSPLGIELHMMFYQYVTSDDVNNTTFLHMNIFNRGPLSYAEIKLSLFMDYDLGSYDDDYIGTDSTRNMTYVYNSIDVDPGNSGLVPYGANCPAFGAVFLNRTLYSSMAFSNSPGPQGDPTSVLDYFNFMNAIWKDGTHLVNDGGAGTGTGYETNYIFTGNPYSNSGWTETGATNIPGDRRMIMTTHLSELQMGESVCIDVAFIYNRSGADHLENMNELLATADFISSFYGSNPTSCGSFLNVTSSQPENHEILIYPNPSQGQISIEVDQNWTAEIYDAKGAIVMSVSGKAGLTQLETNLEPGLYLISVSTEKGTATQKLQIVP